MLYKVNTVPSRFEELIDRISNIAPFLGHIHIFCNLSVTEILHFPTLAQDIVGKFTSSFKVFFCNFFLFVVNFILTTYLKMPLLYRMFWHCNIIIIIIIIKVYLLKLHSE